MRPPARIFALLVAAAVPPLVAFALAEGLANDVVARLGLGTTLLIAAAIAVVWAGIVTTIGSRAISVDARRLVELVEHGGAAEAPAADDLAARLAGALDERNRQIAELAAQSRDAPISLDPAAVATSMVRAARSITADETWELAVMRSSSGAALPTGVFTGDRQEALGEVHGWAATLGPSAGDPPGVRHADGPWGAFVVAEVATSDEVHAILLAPWSGRGEPTRAERGLIGLVAQHAGMALEHALLYGQVRHQANELDRLARLQADFLRGVSHDLQTPLTSIRALAEEARATGASQEASGDLDVIVHQADRLRRMVGQLLAMSRLEAGVLTARADVFRVEPIVERTWAALRSDRPFELRTEGPAHLAVGDPDRIEQALWALLDNAVKYSPAGSPIEVRVQAIEPGTLGIDVVDRGRGMSPETLAHAFDQFYRAPDARNAAPDGSGIGLYTARGLVRAMGGDLSAVSRPGRGSMLRVVLPAEPADAA